MNSTYVNAASILKTIGDGRLVTNVSEGAHGIIIDATVFKGTETLVKLSRFLPYESEAMSKLDIQQDAIVLDAITAASPTAPVISAEGGMTEADADKIVVPAETAPPRNTRKRKTSQKTEVDAPPVEEGIGETETGEEEGIVDAVAETAEAAATETDADAEPDDEAPADIDGKPDAPADEPSSADIPSESGHDVADAASSDEPFDMAAKVASAESLPLTLKDEAAKTLSPKSALWEFVGKPLVELKKRKPSVLRMLASGTGKAADMVTPATVEAAKIIFDSAM